MCEEFKKALRNRNGDFAIPSEVSCFNLNDDVENMKKSGDMLSEHSSQLKTIPQFREENTKSNIRYEKNCLQWRKLSLYSSWIGDRKIIILSYVLNVLQHMSYFDMIHMILFV